MEQFPPVAVENIKKEAKKAGVSLSSGCSRSDLCVTVTVRPCTWVGSVRCGAMRCLQVEARRILFGNTLPKKEYLERGALADLFLDTPLVNAHTSVVPVAGARTNTFQFGGAGTDMQ